jgi:penicillin-binding protein 1A
MGRDDAKPMPGLQGGRNPAQAFSAFMQVALRTRPVQNFDTQVTLPEWQLEPDEEAYYGDPDQQFGNEEGAVPEQEGEAPPPAGDDTVAAPEQPAAEAPPAPARRIPATPTANDNRRQREDPSVVDDVLRDLRTQGARPPR